MAISPIFTSAALPWPIPNQFTPNLFDSPPHVHGIAGCDYHAHPSTTAFPIAPDIRNIKKNRTCLSEAVRRPFSSCGGRTDLLLHSDGLEYIGDETAAVERSKPDQKEVRIMIFSFWMYQNTRRPHQSIANWCLSLIKCPQTPPASYQPSKTPIDVSLLLTHSPGPSRKPSLPATSKKSLHHLQSCRRPFSSCGSPTNFLSHSISLEWIVDEIVALERSKLDHKKVRYHVFS
jgi:hypothetical protein